jgi:DNA gyrase subunit B
MAQAIRKELHDSNLVYRIEAEDLLSWRAVFSHSGNGATPPTIVDSALYHMGELREIRRLSSELADYEAPFKITQGSEELSFDGLKGVADAVVAAGQKGVDIQRYKGLGEMNPEQLWATTMNPETRSMLKMQIGSQEQAEEIFRKLMSDQVEPRRLFIEENALNVKNLDI